MPRRKMEEHNVRNIQKTHGSYYVTLPIDAVRELGWQERQKVVVRRTGKNRITITDWEK